MNKFYYALPESLQNIVLSTYGYKLKRIRYSKDFYKRLEFLSKSLHWSESELKSYQERQLKMLIEYVYTNIPYYSEIMKNLHLQPSDFNTIDDLRKLPILTKEDIRNNYDKIINTKVHAKTSRLSTSGSSGTPMSIVMTDEAVAYEFANNWRQKNIWGIDFGNKFASFNGRMIISPKSNSKRIWRKNYALNQTLFSLAHLKKDNIPNIIIELESLKLDYINGYQSTIGYIADYILEKKIKLENPPSVIFTGSESLDQTTREKIELAFKSKISDRYGSAERVCTFMQHTDGLYYHNAEDGIVELMDDDSGYKKLVCTGFNNLAMPLIRYDIGDLVDEKLTINKSFDRLAVSSIVGRQDDLVYTPDGRVNGRMSHIFKGIHSIRRAQVVQEKLDSLLFNLEVNDTFKDDDKKQLLKNAEERLGKMNFTVNIVDEIPLSKNGKFKAVINKVKI